MVQLMRQSTIYRRHEERLSRTYAMKGADGLTNERSVAETQRPVVNNTQPSDSFFLPDTTSFSASVASCSHNDKKLGTSEAGKGHSAEAIPYVVAGAGLAAAIKSSVETPFAQAVKPALFPSQLQSNSSRSLCSEASSVEVVEGLCGAVLRAAKPKSAAAAASTATQQISSSRAVVAAAPAVATVWVAYRVAWNVMMKRGGGAQGIRRNASAVSRP